MKELLAAVLKVLETLFKGNDNTHKVHVSAKGKSKIKTKVITGNTTTYHSVYISATPPQCYTTVLVENQERNIKAACVFFVGAALYLPIALIYFPVILSYNFLVMACCFWVSYLLRKYTYRYVDKVYEHMFDRLGRYIEIHIGYKVVFIGLTCLLFMVLEIMLLSSLKDRGRHFTKTTEITTFAV